MRLRRPCDCTARTPVPPKRLSPPSRRIVSAVSSSDTRDEGFQLIAKVLSCRYFRKHETKAPRPSNTSKDPPSCRGNPARSIDAHHQRRLVARTHALPRPEWVCTAPSVGKHPAYFIRPQRTYPLQVLPKPHAVALYHHQAVNDITYTPSVLPNNAPLPTICPRIYHFTDICSMSSTQRSFFIFA